MLYVSAHVQTPAHHPLPICQIFPVNHEPSDIVMKLKIFQSNLTDWASLICWRLYNTIVRCKNAIVVAAERACCSDDELPCAVRVGRHSWTVWCMLNVVSRLKIVVIERHEYACTAQYAPYSDAPCAVNSPATTTTYVNHMRTIMFNKRLVR